MPTFGRDQQLPSTAYNHQARLCFHEGRTSARSSAIGGLSQLPAGSAPMK